jgi:hypothetical protein
MIRLIELINGSFIYDFSDDEDADIDCVDDQITAIRNKWA